jgi:hypothetical protein
MFDELKISSRTLAQELTPCNRKFPALRKESALAHAERGGEGGEKFLAGSNRGGRWSVERRSETPYVVSYIELVGSEVTSF